MRHRKKTKTLSRSKSHRKQLMRNLAKSLIKEESIKTTLTKAKELRKFVEPLVTKSQDDSEAMRRKLMSALNDAQAVQKLQDDLGPRFADRPGGYTRIIKLKPRERDGGERALIEFVE